MLPVTLEDFRLFLHVLAATVWVGGQITLAGLVPVLRKIGVDAPKAVANQFARIAWPAFGILILTGIWNVAADHEQMKNDSQFRNTLMLKLVIVALSGLAAYLHGKATTKAATAAWGAATAVFALAALFVGIMLAS
ncbi:MAG TPA: hypothetical protein VMH41_01125 [Mycobacteriales bacterium]|nr:hypothetical protein [Mycobacteriales bacterium]